MSDEHKTALENAQASKQEEIDAVLNDASLSTREKMEKGEEIIERYLPVIAQLEGLKQFEVKARVKFFLLAESEEKAREQAMDSFEFPAELDLDVEEIQ